MYVLRTTAYVLTVTALALSPIYLWSSGLPQLSHLSMAAAIGVHALALLRTPIPWRPWWRWALLFAGYTLCVNTLVYIQYRDFHTLLSATYYVFNALVWLHLVGLSNAVGKERFLRVVYLTLWVLLSLEVFLVATGRGRMYNISRAMGTFNDPNQMAHWLIWAAVLLAAVGWALHRTWAPGMIATGLATLGLAFSSSRSGALGLAVILLVYGLMALKAFGRCVRNPGAIRVAPVVLAGSVLVVTIMVLTIVLAALSGDGSLLAPAGAVRDTFVSWVGRFKERTPFTTLEGRGYDRLWKFPEYLVLGSGEGAQERWETRTWFLGEIHSTPAGLLFYYGIPGTFSVFLFVYGLWRRLEPVWLKLFFFAPLAYGVATYNLRNWMFWVGLAVLHIASGYAKEIDAADAENDACCGETAFYTPRGLDGTRA